MLEACSYWLVYRLGKDLTSADALSRMPLPHVPAAVPEPAEVFMLEHAYSEELSTLAVSQAASGIQILSQVVNPVARGQKLVEWTFSHKAAELSLPQGCMLLGSMLIIPQSLRSRVLQLLPAGHPGVEKAEIVAQSHVCWPDIDQDIARMVQICQLCQENQRASLHVEMTPGRSRTDRGPACTWMFGKLLSTTISWFWGMPSPTSHLIGLVTVIEPHCYQHSTMS
ncbi:uncharacterized protein LOC144160626 [Haemaphysalis longicornis]